MTDTTLAPHPVLGEYARVREALRRSAILSNPETGQTVFRSTMASQQILHGIGRAHLDGLPECYINVLDIMEAMTHQRYLLALELQQEALQGISLLPSGEAREILRLDINWMRALSMFAHKRTLTSGLGLAHAEQPSLERQALAGQLLHKRPSGATIDWVMPAVLID